MEAVYWEGIPAQVGGSMEVWRQWVWAWANGYGRRHGA
jgi:hypothetical protein